VLLDAHALLWFLAGHPQLSAAARGLIESAEHQPLVSIANLWEIAIKASLGKLRLARPFEALFPEQLRANGIGVLGLAVRHVAVVATLEFHHRDPFDRLLVAQALAEDLPIISRDSALDAYGVTRLW
jgi:PIN domain nuclease of toxin-antitoxin system